MSSVGNFGGLLRRTYQTWRKFSADARNFTEGEQRIVNVLKQNFAGATEIDVQDISGGCGSMYEVTIAASEFKGMRMVKQHTMVNDALKEEIKEMHGVRINTSVPSKPS